MKRLTLLTLVLILFYTRFVGLDWGLPYPMHPDERNMANAVQGMSCNSKLSECLNPHFFAYGQLPLYLVYGGISLQHFFSRTSSSISFNEATLALRTLSAFASILLVFVLFKTFFLFVDKKHISNPILKGGIFMLLVFSPFAIQFAHFGTTESLLMLFYSSILYFCLLLWKNKINTIKFVVIAGILSGISLGTKTSSTLFLGLPVLAFCCKYFFCDLGSPKGGAPTGDKKNIRDKRWSSFFTLCGYLFLFSSLVFISTFISSPQSFLNWNDFISSMTYESSIGMGKYVPFYTRQFINTTPLLFQFQKILPYVLGYPQLTLSILGFIFLPSFIGRMFILQMARVKGTRQRAQNSSQQALEVLEHWWGKLRVTESEKLILIMFDMLRFALLLYFLPSSFFFAKWTRFIAPAFPLFSLCAALFLYQLFKVKKSIFVIVLLISLLPGIAYLSVYRAPDVRFTASEWMFKNIPTNSKILSETANVVDLPIPSTSSSNPENKYFQIASFNFYDVDANTELQKELPLLVKSADYIIIPSRRIFKNHSQEAYPILNDYYKKLLSGESGFVKVAEFSSYPHITLFGHTLFKLPDENSEETWTVFDHPVIRIYKRALNPNSVKIDYTNYQTINYQIETKTYHLLVADTAEKWEKGLMYVRNTQDVDGLDGMMFTFPDSQIRTFWNKNTLSDLTLYWIEKGKVIGMSSMPSITKTGSVVTFSSPGLADSVIEIIK